MVLNALRHQRDLFSGGPTIGTHVGNVIHAFENLARHRQLQEGAEKPYESSKSSASDKKDSIYKIMLPPPPSNLSIGGMHSIPKQIVRHRPKGKAPDVSSSQTKKLLAYKNESNVLNSLKFEGEFHLNRNHQTNTGSFKVLLPFQAAPSRIPMKVASKRIAGGRKNLIPKPKQTDDHMENDFLRGSTVSQSFIRKTPERTISTYEQNFLMNNDSGFTRPKSHSTRLEPPLIDEVSLRYSEYGNNNNSHASLPQKSHASQFFQPPSSDHAEL